MPPMMKSMKKVPPLQVVAGFSEQPAQDEERQGDKNV
jgi:hypothetical protein